MIKLVVTDVDGTIVPKDELLRPEMVAVIHRLQGSGIRYTIATGRSGGLVRDYLPAMRLDTPYIAGNGGVIMDGERVLMQKTVPLAALRGIFEAASQMGMSLLYSVDGEEYAYEQTDYVAAQQAQFGRYLQTRKPTSDEWQTTQLDKLIVMAKVRDGSLDAIEEICKHLPPTFWYKRYANKAIDILPCEATKEKAVAALAQRLGIAMGDVMTIGDDLNDVEMLRQAGVGVAVANAQPETKAAADYVATQECYLGVIEAIEKFCF